MGSTVLGNRLAADPDLIFYGSLAVGALVEATYAAAVKYGWTK